MKKDKQRSTKYTHETKDQVTGTLLKTGEGVNSGALGSVCSSYFTSVTNRVNLVTNPVISHECGKNPGSVNK